MAWKFDEGIQGFEPQSETFINKVITFSSWTLVALNGLTADNFQRFNYAKISL